jgi:serine-type D-Ala-D-Ala carboxypeptidase/endopeptidase (penicillin-binding protein 4)
VAVRRGSAVLTSCVVVVALMAVGQTGVGADVTPAPIAPPGGAPASDTYATVLRPINAGVGPTPTETGLASRLANPMTSSALGPHFGISVVDVGTRRELFSSDGDAAFTPASTTKVLTAAAALATLGAAARLHTRVLALPAAGPAPTALTTTVPASAAPQASGGPSGPAGVGSPAASPPAVAGPAPERTIVLVGGGDPMLTSLPTGDDELPDYPGWAHLDDLAAQTVAALRQGGVERVRLRYDTSLFSGPPAAAQWARTYTRDVVGPVTALAVDAGRASPYEPGRVADPAAHTVALFAAALRAAGLTVLDKPSQLTAPPGAAQLADVTSAPISAVLEYMLVYSDNDVAEAIARHVALHDGRPATFADGADAVRSEVAKLGVDLTGVTTYDGSGLSRDDLIPPRVLAQTLALAAAGPDPRLRPLVAGLGVAGVNGTFQNRFTDPRSEGARGVLRVKSGSLQGVVSLTGILPDADGHLITFDMVADHVVAGSGLAARTAIERLAAALLSCGCNPAPP